MLPSKLNKTINIAVFKRVGTSCYMLDKIICEYVSIRGNGRGSVFGNMESNEKELFVSHRREFKNWICK